MEQLSRIQSFILAYFGGKVKHDENEDQHMEMNKRPTQVVEWKDIEECLKNDDSEKLEKILVSRNFYAVWRPTGAPAKATPLHKAAELGSVNCMNLLIRSASVQEDKNDFFIDSPDNDGRTPLFMAVQGKKKQAINVLLDGGAHINARNDQGHTVLHMIGYGLSDSSSDENKRKLLFECLDIILAQRDIDLEVKNVWKNTILVEFGMELLKKPSDAVILFCQKLILRGASLDACTTKGKSVKQLLANQLVLTAEIMGELRPPPDRRPLLSQILEFLLMRENGEKIDELLREAQEKSISFSNSYFGRLPLLFYAVKCEDFHTIKVLLKRGADSWKKDLSGKLCLHKALSSGNPDILECIIENMKEKRSLRQGNKINMWKESFGLLLSLVHKGNNLRPKDDVDYSKCIKIFFRHVKINANACRTGSVTQSILHVALSYNNQEVAKLLLERGAFLGARKLVHKRDHGTVLKALKPETLERAMDGCITANFQSSQSNDTVETNPCYILDFNYRFFMPDSTERSEKSIGISVIKTLMEVSRSKVHRKAIKHPLIQVFLYTKWHDFRIFSFINFVLNLVFVTLLILFLHNAKELKIKENMRSIKPNSSSVVNSTVIDEAIMTKEDNIIVYMNSSVSNSTTGEGTVKTFNNASSGKHIILYYSLILFTFYILMREIFQIIHTFRHYVQNFENSLEWFLITVALLFCFPSFNISVDVTKHFSAWTIIVAGYEFLLLLGRVPKFAIYVTMLRRVSLNLIKLVCVYGTLLLAFGVSFTIIFQPTTTADEVQNSEFSNVWSTLTKVITMATGEFDYSDLKENIVTNFTSSVLMFLVFLFLIFIVLMNVMTGLAVSDTEKVIEEATLYSFMARLENIYLIRKMPLIWRWTWFSSFHRSSHIPVLMNLTDRVEWITHKDNKQRKRYKFDGDTAEVIRSYVTSSSRLQQFFMNNNDSSEIDYSDMLSV